MKPKYGAQIRNTVLVGANEDTDYSNVYCKKCGGQHLTKDCTATNEEIEAYLRSESERILTELSELTKTTYTVTEEKWEEKEEVTERKRRRKSGHARREEHEHFNEWQSIQSWCTI